ncbi:L-lactate dehydrogenase [Halothece sp. PCC 7418]|uniref:L-lactate dehydrogenase n=1 Tax=Halothece sp. (strain PCC 7418) TaxID=65093 RepID=UPI0002A0648A|nr:L-lactate dehydrogenase [Halothece sp. PCC 7418]AFZ42738.1 L-lactate dehydrogenase [Halothece sp. PCC 7418]
MNNLFYEFPNNQTEFSRVPSRKGVIIGAGQVGMACAYSLLIQNTLDELVIIDVNQEKLKGEVMDLTHGLPFVEPTQVDAGTIESAVDADIVIITAGAKQKPEQSRLDLVSRNVEIFRSLIPDVVRYAPQAIILIVTNPVDVMTYVSQKFSGLPPSQVLGSGTVLDTARFRSLLAHHFQLDPRSVHAYIIGEHGDSEVPVWSTLNISGRHIFEGETPPEDLINVFEEVKNAAYEIIQRKGATSYAIGLGVTQIVQAILRNQNRILTVSTLIEDFVGIKDICLSLPAVTNAQGVSRIVNLPLSNQEQKQLQDSAQVLRKIIDQLTL